MTFYRRNAFNIIAALALTLACLPSQAQAQDHDAPIFSGHSVTSPLQARAATRPLLAHIVEQDSARQVQVVRADTQQVAIDAERLSINLSPGSPLSVEKLKAYRNDDGTIVWTGVVGGTESSVKRLMRHGPSESVEDPLNMATIARDGDMLTGSIRVDGQLFTIKPIGNGEHAIVEVDEARMPPDDLHGESLPITPMPGGGGIPGDNETVVDVRVTAVFTEAAAKSIGSIKGWAQAVVAEANQGYEGSDVKIRLKLAKVRRTSYAEFNPPGSKGVGSYESFAKDLVRFREKNDGHMDGIHRKRNQDKADLMILVRRDSKDLCGQASSIGSTASTAFAAVSVSCGPGSYTFAHEIGHLQGARHDRATDGSLTPYRYGHGIRRPNAPDGGYRTVMAYPCDAPASCPRMPWISNPGLFYRGQRMGTKKYNDNHRVMNKTRWDISSYR